jgi:hypothetical protein
MTRTKLATTALAAAGMVLALAAATPASATPCPQTSAYDFVKAVNILDNNAMFGNYSTLDEQTGVYEEWQVATDTPMDMPGKKKDGKKKAMPFVVDTSILGTTPAPRTDTSSYWRTLGDKSIETAKVTMAPGVFIGHHLRHAAPNGGALYAA